MKGTIRFRYDRENDVVVATPHWNVDTKEDVLAWFGQYGAYMKQFARKMDVIAVPDDFKIGPTIGVVWGEYRAIAARALHAVHVAGKQQQPGAALRQHERRPIQGRNRRGGDDRRRARGHQGCTTRRERRVGGHR
jgi:hypothetical protein